MNSEPADFDGAAALLRRANGDMRAFVEALAVRLADALPGQVEVERRRDGLFSKTTHVAKIAIAFETCLLTLTVDKGQLRPVRAKVVRGVVIGTQDLGFPAWLDEVVRNTRAVGGTAGATHDLLHDFLLS